MIFSLAIHTIALDMQHSPIWYRGQLMINICATDEFAARSYFARRSLEIFDTLLIIRMIKMMLY